MNITQSRSALRDEFFAARRAQNAGDIAAHSRAIAAHCLASNRVQQASSIASYIALPREVQTAELNTALVDSGKQVFAPVVRGQRMMFAPLRTTLRRAPTGNWQPPLQHCTWLHHLDIVFLPLLAFDAAGNRLGMGGGYYDRCFAAHQRRSTKRPFRVGLGFAWQQAARLPAQNWDVPLHAVVTEQGWYDFPGR